MEDNCKTDGEVKESERPKERMQASDNVVEDGKDPELFVEIHACWKKRGERILTVRLRPVRWTPILSRAPG